MKFVFAAYVFIPEYNEPRSWLQRIRMYNGILEALGKKHEVLSLHQINFEGEINQNGVNYIFKRFPKSHGYLPFKLNRFVSRQNPDVVVVQGLHTPLQVIQLRKTLGRKVGIILHHHGEKPFTGIKKYLQLWASRHVDAYVFASHAIGMEWIKSGNISDTKRIHEVMEVSSVFRPIEKGMARLKTGIKAEKAFLWVGRLNQNKDPLCVVGAFLRYAADNPGAVLYMIYQTDELLPQIQQMLAAYPQQNTVVLVGCIPHDDLLYWYNSADFIVSGSHYEGSGTAIAEAMSCGCVPILTNIPSFRMITDNGQCGILYPAGNQAALLAALMQTEQMEIQAKSKKCISYFNARLSFEAIARDFETIAESI